MKLLIQNLFFLFIMASCTAYSSQGGEKKGYTASDPSIEEMIGQMIMFGFRGFEIAEVSDTAKQHIAKGNVGGIVLFDYDVIKKEAKRNIKSPQQLKQLISDLNKLYDRKLLMAVDQEGGRVNRLKSKYGFPASVSNKYLGTINNLDTTRYYARRNAKTLAEMGFNVNFSPDVDLEINPTNPVIGKVERSYSADVETVVKHASVWIDEHRKEKIISTIKHFPGHGSSDADSHYGVTDITKYWKPEELEPFNILAKQENVAIMTAHVLNSNLDTVPATLSDKIIKGIIRDKWKFEGLVFSDDLHMAAVNALYDFETIILLSLNAGVDIFVFGNNLKYDIDIPSKVIKKVKELIEKGAVTEDRIKQSYDRIMKVKSML